MKAFKLLGSELEEWVFGFVWLISFLLFIVFFNDTIGKINYADKILGVSVACAILGLIASLIIRLLIQIVGLIIYLIKNERQSQL